MPTQWFYSLDGRTMVGPCSAVEMKHLASTGQILPTYRVQAKRPGQDRDGSKRQGTVPAKNRPCGVGGLSGGAFGSEIGADVARLKINGRDQLCLWQRSCTPRGDGAKPLCFWVTLIS